jgi:cell volume regulation protein A
MISVRVPTAAYLLVVAAVAANVIPGLDAPSHHTVERIVNVALVCILFNGGMHIGWERFRASAAPIGVLGVLGTLVTTAGAALLVRYGLDVSWYAALLLATAVAPTDPAVVFSVLGKRTVPGRASAILEGESGANDPVGIALMASLISAGSLTGDAAGKVAGKFCLEMGVGLVIGMVGAGLLLLLLHRVRLPASWLYAAGTLVGALAIFAVAEVARGSGFLAVFVAGILIGDSGAPSKADVDRLQGALSSLAEVVAFLVLGLTIDLSEIARRDVWLPGILLGAALAFVIRPVLVFLCLLPTRVVGAQRWFVLLCGLKGAVPLLLGTSLLTARVADPGRLYGIVVVIVFFSVVVQGAMVPHLVARLWPDERPIS